METLNKALGKFYFKKYASRPPIFLQVVGWTKTAESGSKRLYVYIRQVPLDIKHQLGGGDWTFNYEVIERYATEITNPIYTNNNPIVNGNAIIIPGADFLRYQNQTIPLFRF